MAVLNVLPSVYRIQLNSLSFLLPVKTQVLSVGHSAILQGDKNSAEATTFWICVPVISQMRSSGNALCDIIRQGERPEPSQKVRIIAGAKDCPAHICHKALAKVHLKPKCLLPTFKWDLLQTFCEKQPNCMKMPEMEKCIFAACSLSNVCSLSSE